MGDHYRGCIKGEDRSLDYSCIGVLFCGAPHGALMIFRWNF